MAVQPISMLWSPFMSSLILSGAKYFNVKIHTYVFHMIPRTNSDYLKITLLWDVASFRINSVFLRPLDPEDGGGTLFRIIYKP